GQDAPGHFDAGGLAQDAQHRGAGADLDIVTVGADAEEALDVPEAAEGDHAQDPLPCPLPQASRGAGGRSTMQELPRSTPHAVFMSPFCFNQTCHGALPRPTRSSSSIFSLNVSMHAQKPS